MCFPIGSRFPKAIRPSMKIRGMLAEKASHRLSLRFTYCIDFWMWDINCVDSIIIIIDKNNAATAARISHHTKPKRIFSIPRTISNIAVEIDSAIISDRVCL